MLASASPRRRTLMRQVLGDDVPLVIVAADVDEAAIAASFPAEDAEAAVVAIAEAKLRAVRAARSQVNGGGEWLVAADTVVFAPDREVLGKPTDADDAARMMHKMSDGTIHVVTAIATVGPHASVATELVTTGVDLGPIDQRAIDAYLRTDVPWDKAGALELQGASAQFVTGVHGCWSNVIGLPVCAVAQRLRASGWGSLLRVVEPLCVDRAGQRCPRAAPAR